VRPLGVGIVGCGWAATDMARAIDALPTAVIAAAHDVNQDTAARLTARHGGALHTSLDDLLADQAVDVVYVAVPHHLLARTAHRVLSAGRHALVEKPMGIDEASVSALRYLAADRALALGVVFELRETGAVRQARQLVRAGAIGPVRAVRIRTIIDKPMTYWQSAPDRDAFDSWRAQRAKAGGGVVLANAIHQIDAVRYITGLSFVRAMAEVATSTAPVEVEDSAAAALRLSNGAIASLVAAAHSPGTTLGENIEIDGELGRLDLNPYGQGQVRLYLRQSWEGFPASEWIDLDPTSIDSHLELVRAFVQAVLTGSAPTATGEDAAAALATVLAIYRSAESGRAVEVSPARSP
jgi:UDP-N-acetyl-2-amino-2-deoxyglucuronate dehydrogenase